MFTRTLAAACFALALTTSLAPSAYAEKAPVYTGFLSNTAAQGYDVVAYFTDGAPVKGNKEFATEYNGAVFQFSSQANLDAFFAEPSAYAPQYGGYCAWAISQGYTAKGDASYWAIVDGKLYLNYNKKVQSDWDQNRSEFIAGADKNWPSVLTK